MTTSLIPETAPFNSEQRAWLNGFLAGWTGLHETATNASNDPAALALEMLTPETSTNGQVEEEFPWHDESLSLDERLALAAGKPLARRLMAGMAQLDCGACGYLCQTYSEAIANGTEKSLTLCSPGGKETSKALKRLLKEDKSTDTGSTNGQAASATLPAATTNGDASAYSRVNPLLAKLKESRNLNGPDSAKHTRHVVIDLAGSGLSYQVGDALGVFPTNCPELVDAILTHLSFDLSNGAGGELRQALLEKYDLNEVSEELIELLIGQVVDAEESEHLAQLLNEDCYEDLDVLDALQLASSARLEAASVVARLSPLNPRLYSIASSLRVHPDEVHLTIGRVTCEAGGRVRKGVASTMFADRLQPADTVRIFTHAADGFTVPADPKAPMIMVGPGTGIAPFRAFLEERHAAGATGENWLFFGDQHAATDFLYQEELEALQDQQILTRLDTAFSRDQEEKIYVQDRILENGSELFQWLEREAYFFVCGDARRMAVDVDRALHEAVATHGQMPADRAADYVKRLKQAKRYVRDVY